VSMYRENVNQNVNGKAEQTVLAVELEDQLIHFSHARKLSKGDVAPRILRRIAFPNC